MPEYLDVGVVRIQSYIARTPNLSLRRGASWMINVATRADAINAWISDSGLHQVARNPEAGHADGVVALTVPAGTAASHATRLLLHLRRLLPGADLQASWGQAASYVEFRGQPPRDDQSLVALPPVPDFPLAETCESCRVDWRDRATTLCADCTARAAVAGRRSNRPGPAGQDAVRREADALGTERLVIDAVGEALGRALRPVGDMSQLAQLGEESGNRNHVATVAADGNGLGAFFTALTRYQDPSIKKRISPVISAATRNALIAAARSVTVVTDHALPVIPHVLGGDDMVVSVTADRAWPFTRAFLADFGAAMGAAAGALELPGPLRARLPSMSAGMVFAHATFPYARATRLAEGELRRAKRESGGAVPAVSWLDVTADGETRPALRVTQTLDTLNREAGRITALAAVPSAGRQVLARLLARDDEEEAEAAALSWARRNGHSQVGALLETRSVTDVRNLLALTRWWR